MITKLARNLGQQPGPRAAAVAALLPLGVRSRSESHASDLAGRPGRGGRPIVVMGTPRGGTTTVLRVLGRALQAPAVFEPFGFNHLELATFSAANESFSLGLPIEESRQLVRMRERVVRIPQHYVLECDESIRSFRRVPPACMKQLADRMHLVDRDEPIA